jgi:hypothetical protein
VIGVGRPKSSFERDAAIAAGHPRFFTGKPCKLGHVAERLTVNRQCVECARLLRRTETGRARAGAGSILQIERYKTRYKTVL